MTIISITAQISIHDIFGETGCSIFGASVWIHNFLLGIGGFGMAVFRLICIENYVKQIDKTKLAKILHAVEFLIVIGVIAIWKFGLSNTAGEKTLVAQFFKDYSLAKADILNSYQNYESDKLGHHLRFWVLLILQLMSVCEIIIYIRIYHTLWNHDEGMKNKISSNELCQRKRKNIIGLSGQVISFVVEFCTWMLTIAYTLIPISVDASLVPIIMAAFTSITSISQLWASHELKRYIKSKFIN